jgi:hypothetical protein
VESQVVRESTAFDRSLDEQHRYTVVLTEWVKGGSGYEILQVLVGRDVETKLRVYLGPSLIEVLFLVSWFPQTFTCRFLP